MTVTETEKLQNMANAIRALAMDAVQKCGNGHPGLPMGSADIATVLFSKFLNVDPKDPKWADRDRFVLSAGHGSMLQYAVHHLLGYEDMTIEQLKNLRQLGSITAGHPEYGHVQGVEATTGPLGQGISMAVGMAIGERMMNARFGDDIVDHYTYVLAGDGCLMEGISQEAISLAGHMKLHKMVVLWDDNNITIDGTVDLADSTDQIMRFKACGWNVVSCDGHNFTEIETALNAAKASDKPTMIACKTTIGYGAPNKMGTSGAHGAALGVDEVAAARKFLNWPHEPFDIPCEIRDAWRLAGLKSCQAHKSWQKRHDALDAETRGEFDRLMRGDLPSGLTKAFADFKKQLAKDLPKVATRKASQMTLEVINAIVPETIGGSADLTGSNLTNTKETTAITADDFSGRFINYGVREHVMGAVLNGLALHGGFIPYTGTFFVFTDYLRPALRLGAIMGLHNIYVMTHDSIGVGEDGPTHQPVEHLASVRCMPNVNVFRPADATETAECWQLALEDKSRPSIICLTRQGVAPVRTEYTEKNLSSYGAYEVATHDDADVSIFASGSEVGIALEAKEELMRKGISSRVVSVPSFEAFNTQSSAYKATILGNAKVNVAVEAAVRMGWDQFIGVDGIFIGMDGFGASAPMADLYKKFGITAENLVSQVEAKLNQAS
ncbi:MAG: transketolase [Rhizobiales bacterium]|nr:transketolase [Hyphomicrobiales bacterium]NRB14170.1 transketolase [Hyphomicrobiales bacterium]